MKTNKNIAQFIVLTKKHFKTYLGISIAIVLFIQFFQPFAIAKFDFENKLLFISGFGLIALIFLLITQIIFQNCFVKTNDESFRNSNSIYIPLHFITLIVTSCLSFIFYIRYVGQSDITFNIVVRVVFICMSLPITINLKNTINFYQSRIKKLAQESRSMQEQLKLFSENYANKYIELISENESDNFRILVSEIVYAKSADNYVEIGYLDEGTVKKKMIRNTLRNIEQQLKEFNNFIRTHRTSLVNIQYIVKLNKNFNNYWLSLDKTKEPIPVSRQFLMAVKELI